MPNPLDAVDLRAPRAGTAVDAELAAQAAVLAELGPDVDALLDGRRRPAARRQAAAGGLPLLGLPRGRAARLRRAGPAGDRDGVLPGRRADPRRRHGRLRHPPRDAGRAPGARRPRTPRGGWAGDADRFGVAGAILAGNLCLTWTDELFATCGLPAGRPGPRPPGVRPDAHPADGRAVPRRRRVGAAAGRAWPTRSGSSGPGRGHPLQEREVHRRAPAAHRRDRRRRRAPTTSRRCRATASTSARPSSCATTCSASSATPPRPASPPATTCARASAPCSRPRPRGHRRRAAARGSRPASAAPTSTPTASTSCARSSWPRARWTRSRPRSPGSPARPALALKSTSGLDAAPSTCSTS